MGNKDALFGRATVIRNDSIPAYHDTRLTGFNYADDPESKRARRAMRREELRERKRKNKNRDEFSKMIRKSSLVFFSLATVGFLTMLAVIVLTSLKTDSVTEMGIVSSILTFVVELTRALMN